MTEQPALAGLDLPPPATVQASAHPDDQLPGLAVCGFVEGTVIVRDTAEHAVVLELLVRQHTAHHPRAVPVLARLQMPDLGSWAVTRDAANALSASITRAGYVIAVGRGLEPGHFHGAEVLRLIRCDRIDPATPGEH